MALEYTIVIKCTVCNGTGIVADGESGTKPCPKCAGTGKLEFGEIWSVD